MPLKLNERSLANLKGVHPDLVRVVMRCVNDWDDDELGFIVTCGVRTLEQQKKLKAKGASKTLRSRHIPGPKGYSHAIDVAATLDGDVKWDWPLYKVIADRMKAAARAERVPVFWGGDWKSWKDGPHYELPRQKYPD